MGLANLLTALGYTARSGEFGVLAREARRRAWSNWRHIGVRRDLTQPFDAPAARIPITIRPLRDDDIPLLLDSKLAGASGRDPYVHMHRLNFLQAGLPTCYVAATEEDRPVFIQWLLEPKDNDRIQAYFGERFPLLAPDEALLEFGYTVAAFRGLRIMPAALAIIAALAADFGARYVISFSDSQNTAALKGLMRAGFSPYMERTDHWRCFRRRCTFDPLPAGTPFPFE
ncbi:MAG: N-acetyltransferase [Anaerolineae bacterium]|nr:N-acetyltransferase [Anaerolineae bacterium]